MFVVFLTEDFFLFSLSSLFVQWKKYVQTYGWRWPLINAVECIWKIGPTKPYSYNSRKHTHIPNPTHMDGWMDGCDLWSVWITDTKLLWHHRTHTCKLCATCTSCNTHAIRKQGKSALTPRTRVKNAPPWPELKTATSMHHRPEMLLLHYQQCSFCKAI